MRLSTSFVAIRKITSSTSAADFDGDKIEQLARQIVKSEGIIRPLVLNRTSLESYEVVEGHFEYHAAVRAREIDLRRAEMIAAYILDPENDDVSDAIAEQIELLRDPPEIVEHDSESLINSINSIKHTISEQIRSLKSGLQDVNAKLDASSNNASERTNDANLNLSSNPDQSFILAVVEKLSERVFEVEKILRDIKQFLIKPDKSQEVLDGFNNLSRDEIEVKIFNAGFKAKAKSFAQGIYDGRQSKPYNSVSDVKVSGIGKGTMEKIISKW
jgi:hypothetical protein